MSSEQPPDYSKYTKEQLEDALAHVDRQRFPDRVAAIEVALAEFLAQPELSAGASATNTDRQVASSAITAVFFFSLLVICSWPVLRSLMHNLKGELWFLSLISLGFSIIYAEARKSRIGAFMAVLSGAVFMISVDLSLQQLGLAGGIATLSLIGLGFTIAVVAHKEMATQASSRWVTLLNRFAGHNGWRTAAIFYFSLASVLSWPVLHDLADHRAGHDVGLFWPWLFSLISLGYSIKYAVDRKSLMGVYMAVWSGGVAYVTGVQGVAGAWVDAILAG
jgi:hypothetical protein